MSLDRIATLYQAQGKYADAEPLYERELVNLEKSLGPERLQLAKSLANYAALLRKIGRSAEAANLEARAKAICVKRAGGIRSVQGLTPSIANSTVFHPSYY